MSAQPIGRRIEISDYGLVGDTRTAALVAPDGAVDWLCLPRFDSPPVFGRLLGGDDAGTFAIGPAARSTSPPRRRYIGLTTTLETTWALAGSELVLTDSMVAEVEGRLLPSTVLVRRIEARGDAVVVMVRFDPRFGYERRAPRRVRRVGTALVLDDSGLAIALTCDADTRTGSSTTAIAPGQESQMVVPAGTAVTFVLAATFGGPAVIVPPGCGLTAAERDARGWADWTSTIDVDAPHRDIVTRSLLTLQLLTYSPSGAPVAAPTTSLPEVVGGGRNWDYRYAWPRDASIGIAAFLAAGKHQEAASFLAWLLHASRLERPRLPSMFDLDGRPVPDERQLDDWPGYSGSRPVRVGNGATHQHQLDGYGWVVDAASLYVRSGHRLNGETWRTVASFADRVAGTWRDADAGIWERRDAPRHHVHSKLMAWLALDRAVRLADASDHRSGVAHRSGTRRAQRRRDRWAHERDLLAADIRAHGVDPVLGHYTASYGSTALDAALLLLPAIGFDPPDSATVAATIDDVARELTAGGPLLYRYRSEDGLTGAEGAFLPCSFWLVQALALTGRRHEATALFDDLVALAGPLGLFAEEIDPATGAHLGNFPQALTHAALLQAAVALSSSSRDRLGSASG